MKMPMVMLVALFMAMPVVAEQAEEIRFVTCPIYRDTDIGRKSGCWLADDPVDGVRYDIGSSWRRPHWAYGVLVEGSIMEGATDTCGGIRLDPVRTSVLYDMKCPMHMLPAEGYSGRIPARSKRYVMPVFVKRDIPQPPFKNEIFSISYDFNSDFVSYNHNDYYFDLASAWIRAAKPHKIVVTGWAATDPVTISGKIMRESPDIARSRALKIHESLLRRGVNPDIIEVHWKGAAQPADIAAADGLLEASRRRVDIEGFVD